MTTKSPEPRLKLPFKTRVIISLLTTVTDFARRRDGTVNRRLLSFLAPLAPPTPAAPVNGVRSTDVSVDPARNLWFRLFLPSGGGHVGGGRVPVVVFFHGGGFTFLSPASRVYDDVCRRLARELSAAVISVNYRLSPEHKYPAQYVDGLDVLRFLDSADLSSVENGSAGSAMLADLHLDLSNCFLMGDSAGGNIAHHVAKYYADTKEWKRVTLRGLITVQPYFGGEERTEAELRLKEAPLVSVEKTDWHWRAFLPEGADRDHVAANVFGGRGGEELLGEGFPAAAMVVVGGWDPLQDWQRRYAEGLRRRGKEVRVVEYEDGVHAFYVFPELEESGMLVEEVREFMETHKRVSQPKDLSTNFMKRSLQDALSQEKR